MIVLVAAVPLGAGAVTSKAPGAPAPFVSSLPPPADIQRIVDDRVITYHDTVGLIVGVIDPTGRAFYARGPARVGNDDPVDGNTIFEIGAVTKTFTGLLLTDMAHRGQLALSDPAEKYAPGVPRHGAKPITLLDLATHTSGLPRMPPNTAASDLNNPNADLSVQQFLDSLARYELTRDAGQGYEYSNAGYDLLGLIEEKAGGAAFGELLKSRVLTPLRMDHTWFGTPAADKDLLANGYDAHLRPAPRSDPPTLPGADGMRSTANDLLDLLGAALGLTTTPLAPALADMVRTERPDAVCRAEGRDRLACGDPAWRRDDLGERPDRRVSRVHRLCAQGAGRRRRAVECGQHDRRYRGAHPRQGHAAAHPAPRGGDQPGGIGPIISASIRSARRSISRCRATPTGCSSRGRRSRGRNYSQRATGSSS